MFTIAGRTIGYSFLQRSLNFPGLSLAIIHILFGGSLETTLVTIQDCPDLDICDAVKMLDGDTELKEFDSIYQLCLLWDLPAPNATNRKWLSEKLLLHAVMSKCFYLLYFSFSTHVNLSTLVLNRLNSLSLNNIQYNVFNEYSKEHFPYPYFVILLFKDIRHKSFKQS